ncbi:protein NRT1/ PTR FAMILY 5.10-like [Triticum aestivum]|uniref:protein NRT1/ PTR FAMILY 5.10-like n=1 Tax=Triticum aestivum TaxID=4565 RepID=UPI001D016CB4|nr:protein NRT1/ PTR FAMILY 5.10-like [Triticum aestivum]
MSKEASRRWHWWTPRLPFSDYRGRPVYHGTSGGWRSAIFVAVVEGAGSFAYYGVSANLITYLTGPLGHSKAAAATAVNVWTGTARLLPLLGAFVADSWLGRYRSIILACTLYVLGYGMITLASTLLAQQSSPTLDNDSSSRPLSLQVAFFYASLYLIAFAQGADKPCGLSFTADQFDPDHPSECAARSSFFNWWHFSIAVGIGIAINVVSYIQENFGWGIGFGMLCTAMICAFVEFFYDQMPKELRSLGIALYCSVIGVGGFISGALISLIDRITRSGGGDSWFSDNLNRAHLDYFYWVLAGLSAAELVLYIYFARSYVYKDKRDRANLNISSCFCSPPTLAPLASVLAPPVTTFLPSHGALKNSSPPQRHPLGAGHRHPERPLPRPRRPRVQERRLPQVEDLFTIAVTTYALEDHLTTETPSTDPTWLHLDVTVLCWLYASMAMDIVDLVMPTDPATATAYKVWTSVLALFNDNKKSHEIYLAEEFHNIK